MCLKNVVNWLENCYSSIRTFSTYFFVITSILLIGLHGLSELPIRPRFSRISSATVLPRLGAGDIGTGARQEPIDAATLQFVLEVSLRFFLIINLLWSIVAPKLYYCAYNFGVWLEQKFLKRANMYDFIHYFVIMILSTMLPLGPGIGLGAYRTWCDTAEESKLSK